MQNISFIAHHFASLFQIIATSLFLAVALHSRAVITRAMLALALSLTQDNDLRGENFLTQHSPAHSLEGCCAPPPFQAPRDQAASASAHKLSCAWPFFGVSSSQLSLLPT